MGTEIYTTSENYGLCSCKVAATQATCILVFVRMQQDFCVVAPEVGQLPPDDLKESAPLIVSVLRL